MIYWSAHLTFLFREVPFLERFRAAADAGFGVVEYVWENVDPDDLVTAKQAAGVQVGLFGIDLGDFAKGDRSFPNIPEYREWWRGRAEEAFRMAERLETRQINVVVGNKDPRYTRREMIDCLYENLEWAIPRAREAGVCLVIEPLNRFDSPRYLMEQTSEVVEVIEHFNSPALQLQLDLYHVQRSQGNVVRVMQEYFPHIRHIQIADSPDRHQPGTGEVNWKFVLGQLEALGYAGYVGIEYHPVPNTLESLEWLPKDKRRACGVNELVW